ncbi:MAG TPA: hypothetical protein VG433_15265 [Pirellulales bacterium]|nr:hypothetical protein [Pirellulales bacterium]
MTLDFDPSGDAAVFDHTLTLVLSQAGQADLALATVSPFRLSQGELGLLADALTSADITRGFSLPVAALAGRTPRPTDTLTDPGGNVWRVQQAELVTCGTRWRTFCRLDR